jgi:predicted nucleotide-binding protein
MNKRQELGKEPIVKGKKGRRAGQLYFPRHSLNESLKLPKTIWEENAGNPMAILDLAAKIGSTPTSSGLAELMRSSQRYGLTEGSWQQDATKKISLTELGKSIVAPKADESVENKMREALEQPRIFQKLFGLFNGKIIPSKDVLINTLTRDHGLLRTDAGLCCNVLFKNITELGLYEDIHGKKYFNLDKLGIVQTTAIIENETDEDQTQSEIPAQSTPPQISTPTPQIPKQIFVAHGKHKRPLEQLEKILYKFKVPYKVAIDEANRGRPISAKVAELMKSCTSGIFIFTADEETLDKDGNTIYRPSDNVVYELGAASVEYGNKIVIFKEESVSFASDFSDIGYIPFEKDKLDVKAADLMLELIELGFMKLTPT